MNHLQTTLPHPARTDIHALGAFVQTLVDQQMTALLAKHAQEYQTLFESIGDMAYGKFNAILFALVRRALDDAGLKASPRLPGSFQSSREWGNADATHQQRWMTSRIVRADATSLGTLAVGCHHDHSRFRLPRSPEIISLDATRPKDVTAALSKIHLEFAEAQEFRDWYSAYLAAGS